MRNKAEGIRISVITPVHNTEIGLFKKTIDSVSGILFEKQGLEFVVVYHNCDDVYIKEADQALADCTYTVRTFVLNDENHTPSAPRNKGLMEALGDYVYFLDSDDTVNPGFIRKAFDTALLHGAQMVVAGARQESVQKNVMPLPMPLLLYSLEGIHIIDNARYLRVTDGVKKRRNADELGRLVYGAPMFLGTKLIDRKFIINSGAYFDNDLEYLEDLCFETKLYGAADRIAVLTDETAYTYWQRKGSTFQNIVSKDRISVDALLEPVKRIVSQCETEDIDYNLFLWSIVEMMGSVILRGDIENAMLAQLKLKMSEYVKKLKPIPYVGSGGGKELASMKFLADIFVDRRHRVYKQDRLDMTFQEMVEKIGEYKGEAIVTDNGSVSYETLDKLSDKIAAFIIHKINDKKSAVGLYMDNSIERIVSVIAVIKSGYPLVVLSKYGSSERLAYAAEAANVGIILTDEDNINTKARFNKDIDVITYSEGSRRECDLDIGALSINDNKPLVIEFTSGSEGNPKGVEFLRRNFISFLYHFDGNVKNCHQAGVSNTYIIHMEVDFLFGLLVSLEALLFGKKLCLLRNARDIGSGFAKRCLLTDEGVSISAVPSVADEWFSNEDYEGLFKKVVLLVYGGEGVKKEQIERAEKALKEGAVIYSGFATTETGPVVNGRVTRDDVNCGNPNEDVCVTIIDEAGNPLPCGEKGRVCVKGYGVSNGYINGSNEDFIIDRSGLNTFISRDEGYIRSTGELMICGRLDRMIKQKGVRIDPSEIEKALISFPGMVNVAAKAFEGAGICCFYTAKEKIDEFKLRVYLSKKLPYFMMPEHFFELEQMPVTDRGKLDLKALVLPEKFNADKNMDGKKAPSYDTLRFLPVILEIFKKEFQLDDIGDNDNFFYLGGDSIRAVKLAVTLCKKGLSVGMKDIFTYPSPVLLARAAEENLTVADKTGNEEPSIIEEYVNDTGRDEYNEPLFEDCIYAYEITGITKGYFTMPVQYREAYRYSLRLQYTTTKELNKDILHNRIKSLVKRHSMLRTEFRTTSSGQVYGFVRKNKDISVTYRNISRYDENTRIAYISGFWKMMDAEDDLFSVACFKINDNSHVMLVRMTHMITDAIGSEIILKELNGINSPDEAEDEFISVKRSIIKKQKEDSARAAEFFKGYLKDAHPAKVNPPFGIVKEHTKVCRRFVRLDKTMRVRLRERAAFLGISFENYIQYEYGKALAEALSEDRIIFLCTFSGRDESNIGIVANFFTVLPVVYDKKMSPQEFAGNILTLNQFSYLDSDMIGKLAGIPFSGLGTAEGINSNIMAGSLDDPEITDARQIIFEDLRGKRMYMDGDELVIEMSYYDMDVTDRVYREIESRLKEVFRLL